MSATDAGQITVTLKLDDKQFNAAAAQADATGKTLSSSFDQRLSSSLKSVSGGFDQVGNSIGSLLKVSGALVIGGAFGANFFLNQASEVQSLRASFESMTGSAENAAKVMSQLNKFSFETAFTSVQIQKAAQQLLGAGLAVQDLGTYLKDIGDIAGATGADLGQLTLPLSQTLARGKLQTQDFYQILNSGAGKLGQVLREELAKKGIGDFAKAMEGGLITSDMLFATIHKAAQEGGFAFQGAIKQAQTWKGKMSNLQETISMVAFQILGIDRASGEIKTGGMFNNLSKAVQNATDWLTINKERIGEIGKLIIENALPAFAGLAAAFVAMKAVTFAVGIGQVVLAFVQLIGALQAGTGVMAAFNVVSAINPFVAIAYAVAALVAALVFLQIKFNIFGKTWAWLTKVMQPVVDMFNKYLLPPLQKIAGFVGGQLKSAWEDFSKSMGEIGKHLKPLLPALKVLGIILGVALVAPLIASVAAFALAVAAITAVVVVVAKVIAWITQFIAFIMNNFKPAILAVGKFFTDAWSTVVKTVQTVFEAIAGFWNTTLKPVFDAIGSVLAVIGGVFLKIFAFIALVVIGTLFIIGGVIKDAMVAIWNFISPTLNLIWGIFKFIFGVIYTVVVWYFTAVYNTIVNVLTTIWNVITTVWNAIAGFFGPILSAIWNTITAAFNAIYNFIAPIVQKVWNTITGAFTGAYNGAKDTLGSLVSFVGGIGGKILGAMGNFGSLLYNSGRDMIQGLLNGAGSLLTNIGKFFLDKVPGWIREPFKKALGIASPSKVFAGYGKNIVQGLAGGIGKSSSLAMSAASKMASDVAGISLGIGGPTLSADNFDGLDIQAKRPVAVSVSVNNSGIVARSRQEWRDINKDGIEAINEELRAKQLPEIGGGALSRGASTA